MVVSSFELNTVIKRAIADDDDIQETVVYIYDLVDGNLVLQDCIDVNTISDSSTNVISWMKLNYVKKVRIHLSNRMSRYQWIPVKGKEDQLKLTYHSLTSSLHDIVVELKKVSNADDVNIIINNII